MKQRTFGGECGVWLKRKKRRLMIDSSTSKHGTTLTQASSEIGSSNSCDLSLKKEDKFWQIECPSSSARLVGWDDIRCRPIYQSLPKSEHSAEYIAKEDIALYKSSANQFQNVSYDSMSSLEKRGQPPGLAETKTERSCGKRKCRSAGLSAAAIEVLHLSCYGPNNAHAPSTSKTTKEEKNGSAKRMPALMKKRIRKNRLSSETSTTLSTSSSLSESDGVSVFSS